MHRKEVPKIHIRATPRLCESVACHLPRKTLLGTWSRHSHDLYHQYSYSKPTKQPCQPPQIPEPAVHIRINENIHLHLDAIIPCLQGLRVNCPLCWTRAEQVGMDSTNDVLNEFFGVHRHLQAIPRLDPEIWAGMLCSCLKSTTTQRPCFSKHVSFYVKPPLENRITSWQYRLQFAQIATTFVSFKPFCIAFHPWLALVKGR
jgi:hypothetical protein